MSTFTAATAVAKNGENSYAADLDPGWTVGDRPHGGYLLAVLTRAALAAAGDVAPDPLAVSAQFLRAPACGPATVTTTVRSSGRTVTVVDTALEQDGRVLVYATVTTGVLPTDDPAWHDVPALPTEPTADAADPAGQPGNVFNVAAVCDMRLDLTTFGLPTGRTDLPPLTRVWVRPHHEDPDPLFTLVAGDISPPVVFNLGRYGWSPTIQLTALLRARPAPGWLAVQAESRSVNGRWFDEDHTVLDATGRLVCQTRQLAIGPPPS